MTLIEIEPHALPLYLTGPLVALLGCLGYVLTRRWPRSLGVVLGLLVIPALLLLGTVQETVTAAREGERSPALVIALALGVLAVGAGLPVLAARQSRARRAA